MARPYHVLMVRSDGQWHGPEFGDYSLSAVQAERQEYRDHYGAKDLAIVTSPGGTQAEIIEAVSEFKAKRAQEV